MNDKIYYGDGKQPKRNTRILDLINQETKDKWKQQEEDLRNKKPPTPEEIRKDFEEIKNKPFKEFLVERTPEETGNIFRLQQKSSYNKLIERLNNGETIKSGDEDLFCSIPELQQDLRQKGIATIITMPTRTEGYKLRKI